MRAVKFLNSTFTTTGPIVVHAGMCRDLTFIGDNYGETRPYRTALSNTLNGPRGAIFIAGASPGLRLEAGAAGGAGISVYGGFFNDIVGLHPFQLARRGSRMAGMLDYFFTNIGFLNLSSVFAQDSTNQLQIYGGDGQRVRIGRRDAAGTATPRIYMYDTAGVERLDLYGDQISLCDVSGAEIVRVDRQGNGSSHWRRLYFPGGAEIKSTANLYLEGTDIRSRALYATTTAGAPNVTVGASGVLQRSTSSVKYKTDVEDASITLSEKAVYDSRPVWYRSLCENDPNDWSYWGFIAEEVAAIDGRLVHWGGENSGEPEGVQYERYVVHLVNVIQQHKKQLDLLTKKVNGLLAS